jgi:hypothetical protein
MITSPPDTLLSIVEYPLLIAIIPSMLIARRILFRVTKSHLPAHIKERLNTPIYLLIWFLLVAFFYKPFTHLVWFFGEPVLALFQQHPLQDPPGITTVWGEVPYFLHLAFMYGFQAIVYLFSLFIGIKASQRLANITSTLNKMDFIFISLGLGAVLYEGLSNFIISIVWRTTPIANMSQVTHPFYFIASWFLAILIIGLLSFLLLHKQFGKLNQAPDNFHLAEGTERNPKQ